MEHTKETNSIKKDQVLVKAMTQGPAHQILLKHGGIPCQSLLRTTIAIQMDHGLLGFHTHRMPGRKLTAAIMLSFHNSQIPDLPSHVHA